MYPGQTLASGPYTTGTRDGGSTLNAQSQRQTIQSEIDRLNGVVADLHGAIDALEQRLQPAIVPTPTAGKALDTAPTPEPLNIAHRICLAVDAARLAGQRITDLTQVLQL